MNGSMLPTIFDHLRPAEILNSQLFSFFCCLPFLPRSGLSVLLSNGWKTRRKWQIFLLRILLTAG